MILSVDLPLRLVNGSNAREHPMARARRAKEHRLVTCGSIRGRARKAWRYPVEVRITRFGPRRMDDDGLAISAKHVRDGVADALRIDDGDPRVVWCYRQERSQDYGVRVEIEEV